MECLAVLPGTDTLGPCVGGDLDPFYTHVFDDTREDDFRYPTDSGILCGILPRIAKNGSRCSRVPATTDKIPHKNHNRHERALLWCQVYNVPPFLTGKLQVHGINGSKSKIPQFLLDYSVVKEHRYLGHVSR